MGTRCRRLLSASASTRRRPARGKQHNITVCSSRESGAAGIRPTRSVPLETVAATTASSQFCHEALVVELFAVVVAARSGRQEVEDTYQSPIVFASAGASRQFSLGIGVGLCSGWVSYVECEVEKTRPSSGLFENRPKN